MVVPLYFCLSYNVSFGATLTHLHVQNISDRDLLTLAACSGNESLIVAKMEKPARHRC
jgi:hypothetical protein